MNPIIDTLSNETQLAGNRPISRYRMAGVLTAATLFAGAIVLGTVARAAPAPDSFADLAANAIPAVVTISTTQVNASAAPGMEEFNLPPGSPFDEFFKDFFDRRRGGNNGEQAPRRRPTSLGSGFLIDKRGYVVTNNHVISGGTEIKVVLHDDTVLEATLIGKDPETDLAVLKVDPKGRDLKTVQFGDSNAARVGDWVFAIGNPFGLGSTVTAGIISARGRDINAGRYDDFIQTDAPINKGNSGGPLFDLNGHVIGVNTLIFSPSGGNVGIGFAVPAEVAKRVVNQLMDHGRVKRGWLGVRIQSVTKDIAENLGLKDASGALVASVGDDSPAAKAGIKAGDVILSFNGRDVPEMRKLPRIVAESRVGEPVPVTVWRGGKEVELTVNVGELTEEAVATTAKPGDQPAQEQGSVDALGLKVAPLTPDLRERYDINNDVKGVVVLEVDQNGPAAKQNIVPGDVIVEVNQNAVSSAGDLANKVHEARQRNKRSVLLMVEGQDGVRFVAVLITG